MADPAPWKQKEAGRGVSQAPTRERQGGTTIINKKGQKIKPKWRKQKLYQKYRQGKVDKADQARQGQTKPAGQGLVT